MNGLLKYGRELLMFTCHFRGESHVDYSTMNSSFIHFLFNLILVCLYIL